MNTADHMTPCLTLNGLSVGYKQGNVMLSLFDDLNLSLFPGQLICFMGPNGAGKSSLIRTIASLQKPLSGEVKLSGSYTHDPSKSIAVVLTDKIAGGNLTVTELVTFGRYPYLDWNVRLSGLDKKIITDAITQIGIQHLSLLKLHTLSDGQLQMAMIARAIAQDTPIILLDEPTAHLDLNNRVEVMNLLRGLARKTNKAILVATHELDLALQTADLIWLTGNAKNILTGIPEDLVLNGSFDEIFQFKGFDLKTGKVQHDAHRGIQVQLNGEGYLYQWTRNALERNGYRILEDGAAISVTVNNNEEGKPQWKIKKSNQQYVANTIAALFEQI
jgi:iron complex transport system ATP-binding protein